MDVELKVVLEQQSCLTYENVYTNISCSTRLSRQTAGVDNQTNVKGEIAAI